MEDKKEVPINCGGCLKPGKGAADWKQWKHYPFKHVKSTWLCPACIPELGEDLLKKVRAGL